MSDMCTEYAECYDGKIIKNTFTGRRYRIELGYKKYKLRELRNNILGDNDYSFAEIRFNLIYYGSRNNRVFWILEKSRCKICMKK